MVIPFGVDEPLALAYQMVSVSRVNSYIRLRVVLDAHGGGCRITWVAASLGRVRPKVLARVGGAVARRHPSIGIHLGEKRHSGPEAANFLRRGRRVAHPISGVAGGISSIALRGDSLTC